MSEYQKAQIFQILANIEQGNLIRSFELIRAKAAAQCLGRLEDHDFSRMVSDVDISINDNDISYNVDMLRISADPNANGYLKNFKYFRASTNAENEDNNEIERLLTNENQNVKRMLLNVLELGRDNILQEEYMRNMHTLEEEAGIENDELSVDTGYADEDDSLEINDEFVPNGNKKRQSEFVPVTNRNYTAKDKTNITRSLCQVMDSKSREKCINKDNSSNCIKQKNDVKYSMIRVPNNDKDSELDISMNTREMTSFQDTSNPKANEVEPATPNTVRTLKRFADIAKNSIFRNEAIGLLQETEDINRSSVLNNNQFNRNVELKPINVTAFKKQNQFIRESNKIEEESELLESEEDIVDLNNDCTINTESNRQVDKSLKESVSLDKSKDFLVSSKQFVPEAVNVDSTKTKTKKEDLEASKHSHMESELLESKAVQNNDEESGSHLKAIIGQERIADSDQRPTKNPKLLNSILNSQIHKDVFKGHFNSEKANSLHMYTPKVNKNYEPTNNAKMQCSEVKDTNNSTSLEKGLVRSELDKAKNGVILKNTELDYTSSDSRLKGSEYNSKVSRRYENLNSGAMENEGEHCNVFKQSLLDSNYTCNNEKVLFSPNKRDSTAQKLPDWENDSKHNEFDAFDEFKDHFDGLESVENDLHTITEKPRVDKNMTKLASLESSKEEYDNDKPSERKSVEKENPLQSSKLTHKNEEQHFPIAYDDVGLPLETNGSFCQQNPNFVTFNRYAIQDGSQPESRLSVDFKDNKEINQPEATDDSIINRREDLKLIKTQAKVNASTQLVHSPTQVKRGRLDFGDNLRASLMKSLVSVRKSMNVGLSLAKLENVMKSIFKKRVMLGFIFIQFMKHRSMDSRIFLGVSILSKIKAIHLRNAYDAVLRYCITNVKTIYLIQQMAYALNKRNLISKLTILKKKKSQKPRKLKYGEIKLFSATFDHMRRNKLFDAFHKIIHVNIMGDSKIEDVRRSRMLGSYNLSIARFRQSTSLDKNRSYNQNRFSCIPLYNRESAITKNNSAESHHIEEKANDRFEDAQTSREEPREEPMERPRESIAQVRNSFKVDLERKDRRIDSFNSYEIEFADEERRSMGYSNLSPVQELRTPISESNNANSNTYLRHITNMRKHITIPDNASNDEIRIEEYSTFNNDPASPILSRISQLIEQVNYVLANISKIAHAEYELIELEILSNVSNLLKKLKELKLKSPELENTANLAMNKTREGLKRLTAHNNTLKRSLGEVRMDAVEQAEPVTPLFNTKHASFGQSEKEEPGSANKNELFAILSDFALTLQKVKFLFTQPSKASNNYFTMGHSAIQPSQFNNPATHDAIGYATSEHKFNSVSLPSELNALLKLAKVEDSITRRNMRYLFFAFHKRLKINFFSIVQRLSNWRYLPRGNTIARSLLIWKKKRNTATDFVMAYIIKVTIRNLKKALKLMILNKGRVKASLENNYGSLVQNSSKEEFDGGSNSYIIEKQNELSSLRSADDYHKNNNANSDPEKTHERIKFVLYKNRDQVKECVNFISANAQVDLKKSN